MDLEQHREPQLAGELPERAQGGERSCRRDEQDGVRAVRARLPNLKLGDDEVLAQHRQRHRGPRRPEIAERAAEVRAVREDGDGRRSAALVRLRQGRRIQPGMDGAPGRARSLHLRDQSTARKWPRRQSVGGQGQLLPLAGVGNRLRDQPGEMAHDAAFRA